MDLWFSGKDLSPALFFFCCTLRTAKTGWGARLGVVLALLLGVEDLEEARTPKAVHEVLKRVIT